MLHIKRHGVVEETKRKVSAYGATFVVPFDTKYIAVDENGNIYAHNSDVYACSDFGSGEWLFTDPLSNAKATLLLEAEDYDIVCPHGWYDTLVEV